MSGPAVLLSPLPTGGAVLLSLYGAGTSTGFTPPSGTVTLTLSRAVSGVTGLGAFQTIYSGDPLPFWLDVNDGPSTSSQPLSPTTAYVWQAADNFGTIQAGPVTPAGSIVTVPDGFTALLIRLLQAGLDNAPRPVGSTVQPAQVTTKMPQGGWAASPFVVVNQDLIQQRDTAVGQDVFNPLADNTWTLPGWVKRVWRVSVFSQDADERDFYRDTLLLIFRVLKATFFTQIGQDVRHSYQAASGTTGDEWTGQSPGFYWADVMLELDGNFDVTILTGFGLIGEIDVNVVLTPPP